MTEVDGVRLGVRAIDFEGADACRIVDRGVLESADLLAASSFECQKLDINLDVVAGNLLVVALCVDFPGVRPTRKPVRDA